MRASIYAGSDYATHANDTIVVMPMIETKEAVQNIDEILSTPGIDAIYVGPADLSLTLGCTPKLDQTEAPVVEALGKILAACKRHKVIAGLHNATSGYALKMAEPGLAVRDARERQPVPRRPGLRGGRRREADGGEREAPRVLSARGRRQRVPVGDKPGRRGPARVALRPRRGRAPVAPRGARALPGAPDGPPLRRRLS